MILIKDQSLNLVISLEEKWLVGGILIMSGNINILVISVKNRCGLMMKEDVFLCFSDNLSPPNPLTLAMK